ncbi:MAG: helix-turn-helix domain-containing protein [Chloroflexi bacterium]|nr:helix-turn-helix domain-containing protein [Chloroflexota bacterium]MBI3733451.1 helix-turn-helix domain-containing protein [Chloroflexota bacterium]
MPTTLRPQNDLISLQQASTLLGVHPSTLRLWADQGKLKAFRTAGGHRRFSLIEVRALAARQTMPAQPEPRNAQLIIHSALGRARMEATSGGLADEPWYQQIDEAAREHHREMGRRLLGLTLHYLSAHDERALLLSEGRALGAEYGTLALRHGLSLGDAMRAYLRFRDLLLESVVQMNEVAGGKSSGDALATYRRVNEFANEVLIAMVAAHQE